MRSITCPKCQAEHDVLQGSDQRRQSGAMVAREKSLLSGEGQVITCPNCKERLVFRLVGRIEQTVPVLG